MSDIAIRVDGLSKQYRIGGPQARYKTLRESLVGAVQSPVRRARRLLRGEAATDLQETIWALKDVSFEVKHGEVLGIIGRNGAGKSTLLKILSRITAPTEGSVDLYGRVGSLLEVGTGFHPELTGRENVYLNGAILGMKRAEIDGKFDEIVAFAELEKFLDTPVKHYSSGMYVRLAFAVAAHLDPEILLVDEVLAVGDAAFQRKCLGKMGEVAGEGRVVLVVSHNLRVVETLSECSLYLREGRLAARGSTLEVVKRYQGESLDQVTDRNLPSEFCVQIRNPLVNLSSIVLVGGPSLGQTGIFEPGQPAELRFELDATEDVANAVVCTRIYRDQLVVFGNNSDHAFGEIALKRGQKRKLHVRFESLSLMPGDYTMVIFVLPSYFSPLSSTVSKFHALSLVVQGSRDYGGGYAYLKQGWSLE